MCLAISTWDVFSWQRHSDVLDKIESVGRCGSMFEEVSRVMRICSFTAGSGLYLVQFCIRAGLNYVISVIFVSHCMKGVYTFVEYDHSGAQN